MTLWANQLGSFLLFAAPIVVLLTRAPSAALLNLAGAFLVMGFGVVVQLVTLPVELDASFNKAMPLLRSGYLESRQLPAAKRILKAAAWTYVAASHATLLDFWRWVSVLRRQYPGTKFSAANHALVIGRIFYLLSVRFDSAAAWLPQNLGGYRWISVLIVAVLCLQLLFTYWGPMHSLFGTSAIDDLAWLWAIMIGLLVFCAVESEKTWRRSGAHARLSRRREPARAE